MVVHSTSPMRETWFHAPVNGTYISYTILAECYLQSCVVQDSQCGAQATSVTCCIREFATEEVHFCYTECSVAEREKEREIGERKKRQREGETARDREREGGSEAREKRGRG